MILIDAQTEPDRCLQTLEILKQDLSLRVIPVIWLIAADHNPEQAHGIDANSIVPVSEDPAELVRTLTQLFKYWLFIVQFPF